MGIDRREIINRIQKRSYELRHLRKEGFKDDSCLDSIVIVNEIKFLFNKLNNREQSDILNKPWLDE